MDPSLFDEPELKFYGHDLNSAKRKLEQHYRLEAMKQFAGIDPNQPGTQSAAVHQHNFIEGRDYPYSKAFMMPDGRYMVKPHLSDPADDPNTPNQSPVLSSLVSRMKR